MPSGLYASVRSFYQVTVRPFNTIFDLSVLLERLGLYVAHYIGANRSLLLIFEIDVTCKYRQGLVRRNTLVQTCKKISNLSVLRGGSVLCALLEFFGGNTLNFKCTL